MGYVPAQASCRTWQLWTHNSSTENRWKGLWNLHPQLRKAAEARHCQWLSLNWIRERLLCKAVKLKPGMLWRSQDVGDARDMVYLTRKTADGEWKQLKRKKSVAGTKAERSWRSEKGFDIRHGDAEFGVCPVGFGFCFGSVFPHYATSPVLDH